MTKPRNKILKVGRSEPIASSDLITFAQSHLDAEGLGDLREQRFRRFGDAAGAQVWVESETMPLDGEGTLTRLSIQRGDTRGAKSGCTKIAEYEEVRAADSNLLQSSAMEAEGSVATARKAEPAKHDSNAQSTADIRRSQIVEGACEVISRKGYAEASVREIADAAGVSIPSLYQYVKSKEDILFLITEGCMQRLFDEFNETIGAALSADAKIEKAIADYLAYISDNRRYINLVYRETRSLSPENRERIFNIERALMKEWEGIVRNGIRSGAFRRVDPAVASNILYFACSVWALRHWALGDYGEEKVRDVLIDLMLDGLRKS